MSCYNKWPNNPATNRKTIYPYNKKRREKILVITYRSIIMGVFVYFCIALLFIVEKSIAATNAHPNVTNVNSTSAAPVCANYFMDRDGKVPINITEYCKNRHCIAKCCRGENRIVFYDAVKVSTACVALEQISKLTNTTLTVDYSSISVYKSNVEDKVEKTKLSLRDFIFIMNKKLSKKDCVSAIPQEQMNNFHILENNSLVMEMPNFYKRFVHFWDMGEFCIDHLVIRTEDHVQGPFRIFKYKNTATINKTENDEDEEIMKSVAMLVSCFFLLLVLFVYRVLRELQNLPGKLVMAYVGTLAVTFFFKAVELLGVYNKVISSDVCKHMSVFLYYTTLSSFFWMNVMSLDLWWTFRGKAKSRQIHRDGVLVKFCWYALYSWGVPLLVTIAVAAIDFSDLTHVPHIYKPHFEFCFYIKGAVIEMRHYLYMPIFVLLVGDWVFFLMTAFNIWRSRRQMAKFANEANKYNNNQNRFGLYLKISLVMGVSWVLEMLELPWWLQRAATVYNSLLGVAIFFVYVFKKNILLKLRKRYKGSQSRANVSRNLQESIQLQQPAVVTESEARSR